MAQSNLLLIKNLQQPGPLDNCVTLFLQPTNNVGRRTGMVTPYSNALLILIQKFVGAASYRILVISPHTATYRDTVHSKHG